jgi:hypothetical protein
MSMTLVVSTSGQPDRVGRWRRCDNSPPINPDRA